MSVGRFVYIPLCIGLLFSTPANALENCVTPPTCDELGFTANAAECSGDALKCPWDTTKAACKVNSIKPITCTVGSVLGGDQLCYEAGKLPDGVSPIGIVFDDLNQLALALTDVKKDGSSGSETMTWASTYYDIPSLTNCMYKIGDSRVDECDVDGRANTTAILGCGSSCGTTYAATVCNGYNPSGCSADFCKKTQWFLPSMRDLAKIYANKSVINASLSLLNSFGAKTLTEGYYWSSIESSYDFAWVFNMKSVNRNGVDKQNTYAYVRPVINYGKQKPAGNIKFVINISNSCPKGLSFSGTWSAAALNQSGNFSCTSEVCYDQGRYDGNGTNETETVVPQGSVITLTGLNGNFTSIKATATGKSVPVSNGMVYFTLNDMDTVLANNKSPYDYWMLQCSGSPIEAKADVSIQVKVPGSSSSFVTLSGSTAMCSATDAKGKTVPITINSSSNTATYSAGTITLHCPPEVQPSSGSYQIYKMSNYVFNGESASAYDTINVTVNPNTSNTLTLNYVMHP